MNSNVSIDVTYVAELARLHLSEEEKTTFQRQLTDILGYVNQLADIDSPALKTSSPPITNHLRQDLPKESLPREIALHNAPQHSAELILMPKVIE